MKKLFLIFLIAFLGCQDASVVRVVYEEPPPAQQEEPPPEDPPPPPEDPPVQADIKFALFDGETVKLWDGYELTDIISGNIKIAGFRKLAVDDVLYYYDEAGNIIASEWLPIMPDHVYVGEYSTIYTFETIPPEEAYDQGALYRHYTRIYKDNTEIMGPWYLNEWEVSEILETLSGHIIIKTVAGQWVNLTDSIVVSEAFHKGLLLHSLATQAGNIVDDSGDYPIAWSMNYFDHSVWLQADGIWYTENGYTWTPEGGIISNANQLYLWNDYYTYPYTYDAPYGENPYIIPAGINYENGEEVTYWIETVTAKLYRHIPSVDRLEMIVELYTPPMTRMGAIPYYNSLDPIIIEGILYYHEGGSLKYYDISSGLVGVFGVDQEVLRW